jgi:Xaa-Pro aminopeptidase
MLSLEPSIKRGLTFWDRSLLPTDEFDERVRLVRAEMRRHGIDALIIAGDMYDDEDLVFLVGYQVDGVFVLPLEAEPAIFTNSGSRESSFLREMTWIADLSHRGAQTGRAVADTLRARGIAGGRIGTVALHGLAGNPYRALMQNLSDYTVEDFTPPYRQLRALPRPRERLAVQMASGIAEKAAAAASRIFAAGGSNAESVIAAERIARREGAWDVRILANLDGMGLRPFERLSATRQSPLLLWVATRYQGYWADRAIDLSPDTTEAARAIEAMVGAIKPGAAVRDVAEHGLHKLSAPARQSALAHGLGGGIGIALNMRPLIHPASTETFAQGMLLSLHVFASQSLSTAIVEVGTNGAVPIPSRPRSSAPEAA